MTRELADERYRASMRARLGTAAEWFGVAVVGEAVFGWSDRSIGVPVSEDARCERRWLRVVAEHISWAEGDWWTGNVDSEAVTGVVKPRVLDHYEWDDGDERLRAELMTLLPGRPCSATPEPRAEIDLSDEWWRGLRRSVDAIAEVDTERVTVEREVFERRLRVFFGDRVEPGTRWRTAHGDLHWANLLRPEPALLDWEFWGTAPAGHDAATLYCYSLMAPTTAARVHDTFADLLDGPDGVRAQLYVIARLLLRAEQGDHPDLVIPLHRHARTLLERAPSERCSPPGSPLP